MFARLATFFARPQPFCSYTVDALWTDPHRSRQMLACHLDPATDLASRRPDAIAAIVSLLDGRLGFAGRAVTDLGCGPGLYAEAIARRGGRVTGLDFSANSLAHARAHAKAEGLDIAYRQADYLGDPLPAAQDIVLLIYGDLCPLSPDRRRRLYDKIRQSLVPGGRFVCDVFSTANFARLAEKESFEHFPRGGFWAEGEHFVFSSTVLYPELRLGLDRYLVVTPETTTDICNWMQYFDEDTIRGELAEAGFGTVETSDVMTGGPVRPDADVFMVVARA